MKTNKILCTALFLILTLTSMACLSACGEADPSEYGIPDGSGVRSR